MNQIDAASVCDACAVYLTGSSGAPTYAAVADSLGMSEGAVKVMKLMVDCELFVFVEQPSVAGTNNASERK